MALDNAYIQGMEDFYNIMKAIYSLDRFQREKYFHESKVANILDKFDFEQIREIANSIEQEETAWKLTPYYIIRGISGSLGSAKKVVAESLKLKFEPTEDMIKAFLELHDEADFAVVEKIYARK